MRKIFLYKREGKFIVQTNTFALVDECDYEKINSFRWYEMRLYHCVTNIVYARRYEGSPRKGNHKAILMHREILQASKRSEKVDHRDGNGLNNQRDNIRISTHSENMSNRKVSYKKQIKYLGVYFDKKRGKYKAVMQKDGNNYAKAGFDTAELAANAYNELIIKYNPNFGKLNIV